MNQLNNPTHPGKILQNVWPEGLTLTVAAQYLEVHRGVLANILNGNAGITANIARRLHNWGGISAECWIQMQNSHYQWIEQRNSQANEASFQIAA